MNDGELRGDDEVSEFGFEMEVRWIDFEISIWTLIVSRQMNDDDEIVIVIVNAMASQYDGWSEMMLMLMVENEVDGDEDEDEQVRMKYEDVMNGVVDALKYHAQLDEMVVLMNDHV